MNASPTTTDADEIAARRRPLKSRQRAWVRVLLSWMLRARIMPNHVSLCSIVFAGAGGLVFVGGMRLHELYAKFICFILAAACIQLRLLCNLMDGLLAVEGKLGSSLGEIYNDAPDRAADSLLLVGCGYALTGGVWHAMGWCAALLAVLTAYVRVLGVSLGAPTLYLGPMAKQHRMALLTFAALGSAVESICHWPPRVLPVALVLIVAGSAITIGRRIAKIANYLRSR